MIFVTVGTHEQQFNRLVEYIDLLKEQEKIKEDVLIQTGYSTYEPKFCRWEKLLPYEEMQKNIADARIVISHGGPASFVAPLQLGKIPIVVPRSHAFEEHVNDHQVEFVKTVAERMGTIIPVYEITELADILQDYDNIVAAMPSEMKSHNAEFNYHLEELVENIVDK